MKKILLKGAVIFLLAMRFSALHYKVSYQDFQIDEKINVEVRGEVHEEGIYQAERGETVADLLATITLNEDADLRSIPLNQKLYEGFLLVIPKNTPLPKISINSATVEMLETIKGISASLAEEIVRYRNQSGSFTSLEELLEVKGIGKKKLEKILPFICL